MVKSQPDQVFIVTNVISHKKVEAPPSDIPPKIPPRMKKNGPALPEKPPHIKAALKAQSQPQPSQPPREPLRPRAPHNNVLEGREVLVAASRAVRERPVEKRQREPAKLLMPLSGTAKKEVKREDRIVKKMDYHPLKSEVNSKHHESHKKSSRAAVPQPLLLIPRGLLTTWTPVSYALWTQRGPRLEPGPAKGAPGGPASSTSRQQRSGSVARSGSLTSQGSSSSDSGNETFPKSVLKKQKRGTCPTSNKGGSCSNRDHKKNVTFNAFATVQLMEE